MKKMKDRYQIQVGFSDHSGDIFACLAATSLGAEILEFHAVFNHKMFGPDTKASLNIEQISQLVRGVKAINISLRTPHTKEDVLNFTQIKTMFGKSLATRVDVKKGSFISISDLESKKPGDKGISAKYFENIIGQKWNNDLSANSFINENDIA
jgi:N-acetylneuraminate synthase